MKILVLSLPQGFTDTSTINNTNSIMWLRILSQVSIGACSIMETKRLGSQSYKVSTVRFNILDDFIFGHCCPVLITSAITIFGLSYDLKIPPEAT